MSEVPELLTIDEAAPDNGGQSQYGLQAGPTVPGH